MHEQGYPYFITCSVVDWLPVFLESRYCDVIVDSLKYCRENKGLLIHGYVIMPTHLHAITSSVNELSPSIRDFKSFTARAIKKLLEADSNNLLLWALSRAAELGREADEQSFWQDNFHPEMIYSKEFFEQKMDYIHANPLRKGLVSTPGGWRYSSAAAYLEQEDIPLSIDHLDI